MSVINFGKTISLSEFTTAVCEVGHQVTLIGEGEMGIGKSAVLKEIAKRMPTHLPAYIDCTLLDLCLLYTSPSPRDRTRSRMPSSA